jgi:hypothetical protein
MPRWAALIVLSLVCASACLDVGEVAPERDGGAGSDAQAAGGSFPGGSGGGAGATGSGGSGGSVTPAGLGDPCSADPDCDADAFCLAPWEHGGNGTDSICSKPCCTSADCGSGDLVCFPATNGYGICLPPEAALQSAVGAGATGTTCAADGDCRSGLCEQVCIDTCCSNADCPSSLSECLLRNDPSTGRLGFFCDTPTGTGAFGTPCTTAANCKTNTCAGPSPATCSQACCSRGDCALPAETCGYSGGVRACYHVVTATKLDGASCTASSQCQGGVCAGGRCTAACCTDADCSDPSAPGCRPVVTASDALVLACSALP